MVRRRILQAIDVRRPGLEIGALDQAIVTRDMGPVEYVDRADREGLLHAYAGHTNVNHAAIVDVDHVWGTQSLIEAVGGERRFAYVLASHVIEHVPDLFGWLQEIAAVLEDGGVAAFIVPDKRFTFDLLRRTSHASEMADAYVRRLRRPDPRQLFDHVYYVREDLQPTDISVERQRECLDFIANAYAAGDYHDVHCWVFTPESLLEALDLGNRLGLLPFEIAVAEPTAPGTNEFIVALRRLPEGLGPDASRAAFVESRARHALPEEPAPAVGQDDPAAQAALARLAAIERSTSWRITAPLRAAVTALRSLGRAR